MAETILKIVDLAGQSLDGFEISGINFELSKGEIHVLVGENDSGQKSFISVLAGSTEVKEGDIYYKGKQLAPGEIKVNVNSGIAFLFQNNTLLRYLSVAENLQMAKYPKRKVTSLINWKRVNKEAGQLLKKLNIDIDPKEKVSKLTEEQVQLIEIAKVFMFDPEMVILHEPTENLSTQKVTKLFQILRDYRINGGSVIYVTKNWEEAIKIADNISVLSKGKIVGQFTATEVISNPRKLLKLLDSYSYKENDVDADKNVINYESKEVLDSVFRAAELLTSEYELKDVLLFLAQSVTKAMNADGARIDLLDYSTHSIIDTYAYDSGKPLNVKVKKEFIVQFLENDSLFYSNQNDKEFESYFVDSGEANTIICIPLNIRSRVAGVIQILYKSVYVHSKEEAGYLVAFARQAALSIEDTRLIGRSALLQESHHRIKNNLQAISSFITLQKRYLDEEHKDEVDDILDNIISRIKSIAAVHDLLSKDQLGRSIINIKDLIQEVINFISLESDVQIDIDFEDMFIPYSKATSIALLTNELVCNCNKYAFKGPMKETKQIHITGYRDDKNVYITIKDNGIGFPEGFSIKSIKSLGLTIVTSITKNEFGGTIDFTNNIGAQVDIVMDAGRIFIGR